jgi:predicted nucleic acid-binding protein
MKTAERIMLDANVLVYGYQKKSEFYERSRAILKQGFKGKLSLCICPQVLMEFHATVTNPKRVTVPSSVEESLAEIEKYMTSRNILKIYPTQVAL